jgi:hypothetical protein
VCFEHDDEIRITRHGGLFRIGQRETPELGIDTIDRPGETAHLAMVNGGVVGSRRQCVGHSRPAAQRCAPVQYEARDVNFHRGRRAVGQGRPSIARERA